MNMHNNKQVKLYHHATPMGKCELASTPQSVHIFIVKYMGDASLGSESRIFLQNKSL